MDLDGDNVNHLQRFVFVHIPKTGGQSIEKSFQWKGLRHRPFEYYENKVVNLKEYFKFTFVRNPFDRLVSSYVYIILNLNDETTFDYFVKEMNRNSMETQWRQWKMNSR